MSIRHTGLALLLVFVVSFTGGCERRVSAENFDRIQPGMSKAEIVEILGEPDETSGFGMGDLSGDAATWMSGKDSISVQFVNGKVFAKQAHIGSKTRK
jgi:hypothetical protein